MFFTAAAMPSFDLLCQLEAALSLVHMDSINTKAVRQASFHRNVTTPCRRNITRVKGRLAGLTRSSAIRVSRTLDAKYEDNLQQPSHPSLPRVFGLGRCLILAATMEAALRLIWCKCLES